MVKGGDIIRALNEFDFDIVREKKTDEYRIHITAIHPKRATGVIVTAKSGCDRYLRGNRLTKVDKRKIIVTVLDDRGNPLPGVGTVCSSRLTEVRSLIKRISEGAFKRAA